VGLECLSSVFTCWQREYRTCIFSFPEAQECDVNSKFISCFGVAQFFSKQVNVKRFIVQMSKNVLRKESAKKNITVEENNKNDLHGFFFSCSCI
jgi:hypothetical protein